MICSSLFSQETKPLSVPGIAIVSPTTGSTFAEGDTIAITAETVSSGSFSALDFYVNNVFIGKDSTSPYTCNWISIEGNHLLSVVSADGFCNKVSSVPVSITAKKNVAPQVIITNPVNGATHFSNTSLTITANAADTDGSVSQVDFFINQIFIGSDASYPYEIPWQNIPGAYVITAQATDNKGAQSISPSITINVNPPVNNPPTITITSPSAGSVFTLGNPVNITVNAADADGSVSNVEFFANNVSIGTATTAPFQLNWMGASGKIVLLAKVRDNLCAETTSDTVHITVIDPHAPPYRIETTTGSCNAPVFCLPIAAISPVKDIIGYDMTLHFDKTKVYPTGTLILSDDLINKANLSYKINTIDSLSLIYISIFLNATASSNTAFTGTGKLFCVEFLKASAFLPTDTAHFSVTGLKESYATGVTTKTVAPGDYIQQKNMKYPGLLKFWTDNSPIKYDAANPSQYLITNIHGSNQNCSNKSVAAAHPDLNGKFQHPILNGASIQIERDIFPTTNVQPVINGMDASLGHAVLVNDLSFIPTIYQAIALDVNMDGIISAGDISQINQRSIKTISEFKQKWNYNGDGSSTGKLSKDWLFLDSTLLANPSYKRSTTYPANDGIGYSKNKVPTVPFCLQLPPAPMPDCPIYTDGTFTGVLLGDVNGNYESIPADGDIKKITGEKGSIYLDLEKAILHKGYMDVPVLFSSSERIVALDFSISLNDKALTFTSIQQKANYLNDAEANYDTDDHVLRFTSNSTKSFQADKTIILLRFLTNGSIGASDFYNLIGYLNGERVNMELRGRTTTVLKRAIEERTIQLYPNPASNKLNVIVKEPATVQLTDMQGNPLTIEIAADANEPIELSTEDIKRGTYLLKVTNKRFTVSQQVVIENNK